MDGIDDKLMTQMDGMMLQTRSDLPQADGLTTIALMDERPSQPSTAQPVLTPCIKVCAVDGASGLCFGCGRSLQEIATWARLSEAERSVVMAELPERLKSLEAKLASGVAKPEGETS